MACVDVLSDDDAPLAAPVHAPETAPVPAVAPAAQESQAPPPGPVVGGSVDVLSDSDEDVPAATLPQPPAPTVAVPAPDAVAASEAGRIEPAPPALQAGLRSVVVAHVELADSDDEVCAAAPTPAAAEPAACSEEAARPSLPNLASSAAPREAVEAENSDDEDFALTSLVAPAANVPATTPHMAATSSSLVTKPEKGTPADANATKAIGGESSDDDDFALSSLGASVAKPPPEAAGASSEVDVATNEAGASATTTAKPAKKGKRPGGAVEQAEPTKRAKVGQGVPEKNIPAVAPVATALAAAVPTAGLAAKAEPAKDAKPAPKAEAKDRKLSKDDMDAKVLEYMLQQNRPYNAQNVFDNLHGVVPKNQVQLFLDSNSAAGRLAVKEYGKSKVYLATQMAGDPEAVEKEAQAIKAELAGTESKQRDAKARLDGVRRSMGMVRTLREAVEEAATLAQEAAKLEEHMVTLRSSAEASGGNAARMDEAEVRRVETEFNAAIKHWRSRKRLCMDMLKTFCEGGGVKVDQLVDKYGVDTDEACDQLMPDIVAM